MMKHLCSRSRGFIRSDAGIRRFLSRYLLFAAVVGAAVAHKIPPSSRCRSHDVTLASLSTRHRARRRIRQSAFPVSSRIFEIRAGGGRDSSDKDGNNRNRRRDRRKRNQHNEDSKKRNADAKKDEQPPQKQDNVDKDGSKQELNVAMQQQQPQEQLLKQQKQQHGHHRQAIHFIVEKLTMKSQQFLVDYAKPFLKKSMTRNNLHRLATTAGPTLLALLVATATTNRKTLSLWNLYTWTMVGSSAGFFLFLYFTSVGYALAIGLPLLVMTWSSGISSSWQSIMVILWSIRTVAFLLWREYYNWPALHKRIVQVNNDPKTAPDLLVKVICWFVYSFFYLCMLSPCYYRHKQQLLSQSQLPPPPRLSFCLQVIGLLLESIADVQKSRFKAYPFQRYDWCNVGLWKWSTHPNYIGEWLFWLGTLLGGQVDRPLVAAASSTSTTRTSTSTSPPMPPMPLAAAVSSVLHSNRSDSAARNALRKNLVIPPFLPMDQLPLPPPTATDAGNDDVVKSISTALPMSPWRRFLVMAWSFGLQGTGFMFISIILRGAVYSLDSKHLEKYGRTSTSQSQQQVDDFMRHRQTIGLCGPKRSWWRQQFETWSAWYQEYSAKIRNQLQQASLASSNSTMTNTTNTTAVTDESSNKVKEAEGAADGDDPNPSK